ncbi:MAG: hypothetical protein R2719_15900 [Micropruina sp.]
MAIAAAAIAGLAGPAAYANTAATPHRFGRHRRAGQLQILGGTGRGAGSVRTAARRRHPARAGRNRAAATVEVPAAANSLGLVRADDHADHRRRPVHLGGVTPRTRPATSWPPVPR